MSTNESVVSTVPTVPAPITTGENKAEANLKIRLAELNNLNRIATNAVNLISDTDIKIAHATAVFEIIGWLNGFSKTLAVEIKQLEDMLLKDEKHPGVGG